jgi:transglutaminase/protease-like cytokinesis protein 3
MKWILIFIELLTAFILPAQNLNLRDFEKNVHSLTLHITQNISDDSLKVEAIYNWVTSNIRYDTYFRRRLDGDSSLTQEPDYVIKSKRAVCIGFSKLIKEMCSIAQIKAKIIEGIAKNDGGFRADPDGHAWNVVKINNSWYFLDATWGITSPQFAKKFFLTTPSVFIESHLPHDPLWQLLEQPIAYECFTNNKNCSTAIYFNLKDSLSVWESLDSISRISNEAHRTINYNPKDIRALKQLGEVYAQNASKYYQEYMQIKQIFTHKKLITVSKQVVEELLKQAVQNLNQAKSFYERIIPLVKTNNYTDAHINIDVINENLNTIEEEKAYVLKYFK